MEAHLDQGSDLSMERARTSVSICVFVGKEGPDRSSWNPVVVVDDDGFMVFNPWDGTWRLSSSVNMPCGDRNNLAHAVCYQVLLKSVDDDKARCHSVFAETLKMPEWQEIADDILSSQLSVSVLET